MGKDRRSEKLIGATIDGFPIRIANMLNLTMSDKSTNTLLQTGVFDFMASPLSFTSNEAGDMAISQEVKNLMIKQLVKPELEITDSIVKLIRDKGMYLEYTEGMYEVAVS